MNDNHYKFNFEKINEFLEKNIFKIEKILNCFVKNIYIILDSDELFSVRLSIKKNNNGNYKFKFIYIREFKKFLSIKF